MIDFIKLNLQRLRASDRKKSPQNFIRCELLKFQNSQKIEAEERKAADFKFEIHLAIFRISRFEVRSRFLTLYIQIKKTISVILKGNS